MRFTRGRSPRPLRPPGATADQAHFMIEECADPKPTVEDELSEKSGRTRSAAERLGCNTLFGSRLKCLI